MNRSDVRLSLISMRIASGLPTWIIRLRMALSMRASACWPAQERAIDGTALAFLVSDPVIGSDTPAHCTLLCAVSVI